MWYSKQSLQTTNLNLATVELRSHEIRGGQSVGLPPGEELCYVLGLVVKTPDEAVVVAVCQLRLGHDVRLKLVPVLNLPSKCNPMLYYKRLADRGRRD